MRPHAKSMVFEQEFLLCCVAACDSEAARAQLSLLAERPLDWNYVLSTAESHGILPLLRSRTDEYCRDVLPPIMRTTLARACLLNAGHNLALTGELLRILETLDAAGIEAVPFKGPALAEQLFGNVAMRQFCDLDILVRPAAVKRAKAVLLARGYEAEFVLPPEREAEYIRSEHAFQFRREEGGIVVELHWSFGSRDQSFPLRASEVWNRLERHNLQGRQLNALSPEDLFVYLCMHGAKHKWERLEWICSLAELIRRQPALDWGSIFALARRTGALRGVHLALLLVEDICALALPADLLTRAHADADARVLATQVRESLFLPQPVHRTREFQRHAFYLRSRERLIDRARIVWFSCARIPHPLAPDWDLFQLPSSMSFLYYLLRPLRLFRDYGFRILLG